MFDFQPRDFFLEIDHPVPKRTCGMDVDSHTLIDSTLWLLGQVSLARCLRPRLWTTPAASTRWSTSTFPSKRSSSGWRPAGPTCPAAGFTTQTLTRPKSLWVQLHYHLRLHLHHEGHILAHMITPISLLGLAINLPKHKLRVTWASRKWKDQGFSQKVSRHVDGWLVMIDFEIISGLILFIILRRMLIMVYTCSRMSTMCVSVCVHAK